MYFLPYCAISIQLIIYYFLTFSLPINAVAIEFYFYTLSLHTFSLS